MGTKFYKKFGTHSVIVEKASITYTYLVIISNYYKTEKERNIIMKKLVKKCFFS